MVGTGKCYLKSIFPCLVHNSDVAWLGQRVYLFVSGTYRAREAEDQFVNMMFAYWLDDSIMDCIVDILGI